MPSRRALIGGVAASVAAAALAAPHVRAQARPRVVVIGGGFAGASCARALRQLDGDLAVTLVEPDAAYIACPFSNAVLGGLRGIEAQTFDYDRFDGIALLGKRAVAEYSNINAPASFYSIGAEQSV